MAKESLKEVKSLFIIGFQIIFLGLVQVASAQSTKMDINGKTMHISTTRSLRDLNRNRLELFGNVYIRRPQELLTSDYAVIDLNTEHLVAEGNVVYITSDTVIYGSKMDLNLKTSTGFIEDGRVESEKYQLIGQKLERREEDEFFGEDADYTTCRDCPAAWKIHGKTIHLTVQGYARISQMLIKINDSPVLYFPYLIIPVKTKRQSGFLFPRVRSSSLNGFQFTQPFFWAISRSMDATVAFGKYTGRGYKEELEYRYSLGRRSFGQINGFGLQDRTYIDSYQKRWALEGAMQQGLPFGFDLKFHWLDASDRDYPRFFPEDIPGRGEPALVSEIGISRSWKSLFFSTYAQRSKRVLRADAVGFDDQTVQTLPSMTLALKDQKILDFLPLYFGTSFNYMRFWRVGPSFDTLPPPGEAVPYLPGSYVPGRDPIRRGERFILAPEMYFTSRFFDVLELVPSVQYRSYFYRFDQDVAASTRRGYLVAQAELATSVEKVYSDSFKHKIRPSLTYSRIPFVNQDMGHPFVKQISYGGGNLIDGATGRQFDDNDIVPLSFDVPQYFVPLGNSLTYKLGNSIILKSDGTLASWETPRDGVASKKQNVPQIDYNKIIDVSVGQTINFIEFQKKADAHPLSRAFLISTVSAKRIQSNTEVYYYPYRQAYQISTGLDFFLARYKKRLLSFERKFSIGYSRNRVTANTHVISAGFTWSWNDYFSFGLSRSIDLFARRVTSTAGQIIYQSPSQCYQLSLMIQKSFDRGFEVSPNLVINLNGDGYTNVMDPGSLGNASPSGGSAGGVH